MISCLTYRKNNRIYRHYKCGIIVLFSIINTILSLQGLGNGPSMTDVQVDFKKPSQTLISKKDTDIINAQGIE